MNDDIFDFDIDAELALAEQKTEQKINQLPEVMADEDDCEGCKI